MSPLARAAPSESQVGHRPNVVYMLADDLGWGDLSCHGGSVPTPAIDGLFQSGIELTSFMSWCVCSPTRAMLLTGRHPFRVGTGPGVGGELAESETTIAEVFRDAGYQTGIFGKWHNGDEPDTPAYRAAFAEAWKDFPRKQPRFGLGVNAHGFDEAWVYYGGGGDFFTRRNLRNLGPASWWHNRELRESDPGYTEDLIVDHACEFLRQSAGKPFFCYVPFHIVHEPLQAKEEDLAAVDPAISDPDKRAYAAMLQAMDRNVARILATLDELGLRENTIVIFSSDNGATPQGNNLPLRGRKHTVYEGGVRVPTVFRWPGGGLTGRTWNGLSSGLDMLPTLASLAGVSLPGGLALDGQDIATALRKAEASTVESVYWAWHGVDALRTQRWKLHRMASRVELYDIEADPAEATNVADAHADVVKELTEKMNAWAASTGVALSHKPPKIDGDAAAAGDVLEITATVTAEAKPADVVLAPFATYAGDIQATDHLEFDVAAPADSLQAGFCISPVQQYRDTVTTAFRKGDGIDQFGREQVACPPVRGPAGSWEHRVIGLSTIAPASQVQFACAFRGGTPGTFTIHLDNVRIRHADGSTSPVWADAAHTQTRPVRDTAAFKQVQVRSRAAAAENTPAAKPAKADVVVYGDTSGGVTAAVQAARMGKSVLLISPTGHLGGLTSSGLGATDLGNPAILGGLAREFYHRVYEHYERDDAWKLEPRQKFQNRGQHGKAIDPATKLACAFEPRVAEALFDALASEARVRRINGRLDLKQGVRKDGPRITAIRLEDGSLVEGKVFIDASYEGDLMAAAGVSFVVGREANAEFKEQGNGIVGPRGGNQLPNGIDPYRIAGKPESGLLSGVNPDMGGRVGDGDHRLQAYCYRMVLTDVPANRVPIPKPASYDEADYEILFRAVAADPRARFFKIDLVPNRKTDSNNTGGISCDLIGGNYGPDWNWATLDHAQREAVAARHRDWQLGLVWTLQNHPRIPEAVRERHAAWGLAKDEFPDNGHWPYHLYVREARRMRSDFVMTEHHCRLREPVDDPVALGAYTLDSHNVQRFVNEGQVKNEGDIQMSLGGKPYPIAYRAIVPREAECSNLLVPWALSATHIAFGSIRMEPVFMTLGQSAATAACLAIDAGSSVQTVPYDRLRDRLVADGQQVTAASPRPLPSNR
jgi:arylsulfatase A-like enzyme